MIRIFKEEEKWSFELSNIRGIVIFSGSGYGSAGEVEDWLSSLFAGIRDGFNDVRIEK